MVFGGNSFQYVDFQHMWNVFVLKDYKSNFLKITRWNLYVSLKHCTLLFFSLHILRWITWPSQFPFYNSQRKKWILLESTFDPFVQFSLIFVGKRQTKNVWVIPRKCLLEEEKRPMKDWLYDHVFCTWYIIWFYCPKKDVWTICDADENMIQKEM